MSESVVEGPIGKYVIQTKSSVSTRELNLQKRKSLALLRKHPKPLKLKAKPKPKVIKHYLTAGIQINDHNQRDLELEKSPFAYPKELEEFAYKVMTKAWRNDVRVTNLQKKCANKPSYKQRQKEDLLNRLYVKDDKQADLKTILDIDPDYFQIIEGRPIPDKLSVKDYIQTMRDSLKTKIITGYREDDIMLIEESLRLEQRRIDQINENYLSYVNAFEDFLSKDHSDSMRVLHESEEAARRSFEVYVEYKHLSKEYGALRSVVYKLEEKWRNCKMYQKFLYLISPMSWRKEFDHQNLQITDIDDIFGKYRLSFAEKSGSLNDLIEQFKEDCEADPEPVLYFKDPEELMEIFRYMEMQNLNALLHSEELATPLMIVKGSMRHAEETFDKEIKYLEEAIEKLEGGIQWEEERAKYLEDLSNSMINNEFKKLIIDDKALNLHVFVEDVYETRIGPNDANLSMGDMMKAIEAKYRHELLQLDKLPREQVSAMEGTYYQEEMQIMKLAEKAAREYVELERLTYKLEKALEPPFQKVGKELKKRSPPVNPPKPEVIPPRDLTKKETEYLDFFTDYCHLIDDLKDYGIDINQQRVEKKAEISESEKVVTENAESRMIVNADEDRDTLKEVEINKSDLRN